MAKKLAKEFYEDDLYTYILPNSSTRLKALEIFFYNYINMYPIGTLVFPKQNSDAIGYIFYANHRVSKGKQIKKLIKHSIKMTEMMKYISTKEFVSFCIAINSNSSSWISEFIEDDFIHIDLIVVDKNNRNKGLATQIIKDVIKEADYKNLKVTLETQNIINVEIYKKFGFEVVKEQKYKELTQFCMIR